MGGEHSGVRKVAAARAPAAQWCPSPVPLPGCSIPVRSRWDAALLPREREGARGGREPNWLQSCQAGGSWASLTLMRCPARPNPGRVLVLENKCTNEGGQREVSVQASCISRREHHLGRSALKHPSFMGREAECAPPPADVNTPAMSLPLVSSPLLDPSSPALPSIHGTWIFCSSLQGLAEKQPRSLHISAAQFTGK